MGGGSQLKEVNGVQCPCDELLDILCLFFILRKARMHGCRLEGYQNYGLILEFMGIYARTQFRL